MTGIDAYLAEQKRLAEAATPGPWVAHETNDGSTLRFMRPHPEWTSLDGGRLYLSMGADNAEFIAAARESVPRLVAALEAVVALHRRDPYIPEGKRPWCVCEEPWPCPTISVVEAALGGETDG